MDVNKNFLRETIVGIFNDKIYPEAKLNIKELHQFFDDYGDTYKVLLDLVTDYDSSKITKFLVKDALINKANRTEEEANQLVANMTNARTFNDEEIHRIKIRLKDLCQKAFLARAKEQCGEDGEAFIKLVATYKYKDLGSSDFVIKEIDELDATSLTEKYLSHPIPSKYREINRSFAGKKGYLRSSLGIVCGRPKSGKSLFLMSEAVNFAERGYKVFYLALGDLNELDFLVRMSSISTHEPFDIVYSNVKEYQARLIANYKHAGGRISVTAMPAGKLTAEEFKNIALNRLKDYDVIIIDYDLNFKPESDNMYERGGTLYDMLTEIKMENNQLILVATQPGRSFWGEAILDDTCFIESSKKSMIVDFAVTIGKEANSGTHCGYISLPINRRGNTLELPYIRVNCGELMVVPTSIYAQYANDVTIRDIGYKELTKLLAVSER